MGAARRVVKLDLEDMKLSPTAALFEGKERAGIDITMFVVRTPPGKFVELHVHPYSETFVLLEAAAAGPRERRSPSSARTRCSSCPPTPRTASEMSATSPSWW